MYIQFLVHIGYCGDNCYAFSFLHACMWQNNSDQEQIAMQYTMNFHWGYQGCIYLSLDSG